MTHPADMPLADLLFAFRWSFDVVHAEGLVGDPEVLAGVVAEAERLWPATAAELARRRNFLDLFAEHYVMGEG